MVKPDDGHCNYCLCPTFIMIMIMIMIITIINIYKFICLFFIITVAFQDSCMIILSPQPFISTRAHYRSVVIAWCVFLMKYMYLAKGSIFDVVIRSKLGVILWEKGQKRWGRTVTGCM